jgi:hypothetical protein
VILLARQHAPQLHRGHSLFDVLGLFQGLGCFGLVLNFFGQLEQHPGILPLAVEPLPLPDGLLVTSLLAQQRLGLFLLIPERRIGGDLVDLEQSFL